MNINYITTAIVSAFVAWGITSFFSNRKKNTVVVDTTILLEKIKSVSKLITVEGSFSEIISLIDTKHLFWKFTSEKKMLIITNAKVFIGIDLTQCELTVDKESKSIRLTSIPEPHIIALENKVKFYHTEEGVFNKVTSEDYTKANQEADQRIYEQVSNSSLPEVAKKQALNALHLIEHLAESSGWKFEYDSEKLTPREISNS